MISVGTKVKVEKGCKARGVSKGAVATVTAVQAMGSEYSHSVRVTLSFLNTFLSGKTLTFYARHENRLGDAIVNLNDGRPEHTIQVRALA